MKNYLFQICVFVFFSLFVLWGTSQQIVAQNAYHWDDYGLSFSLPNWYKITANEGEKFEGNAPGMASFGIYPFEDKDLTADDLKNYASQAAKEAGMDMSTAEVDLMEFNGFQGGYAEGKVKGVSVIIIGLINPNSEVNFLVQVVYTNADAAIKFIQSIKKK